jgi:hypothetical protein
LVLNSAVARPSKIMAVLSLLIHTDVCVHVLASGRRASYTGPAFSRVSERGEAARRVPRGSVRTSHFPSAPF